MSKEYKILICMLVITIVALILNIIILVRFMKYENLKI